VSNGLNRLEVEVEVECSLVESFDCTLAPVLRRMNGDSRLHFVDTFADKLVEMDMDYSLVQVAHYIDYP